MSPEIAKLRKRTEVYSYDPFASDMWSLGVTFYYLITGQLPFPGETAREYLKNIRDPSVNYFPLPEGTN
jgi:serine/threonine protein kinase